MTGTEIKDYARRLSRMTDLGAPDTHVNFLINQGIKAFAVGVGGVPMKKYLALTEKFDLSTTMGFNLTITGSTNNDIAATDVAVTATDADDQTGAQAATAMQAAIRTAIGVGADLTVAWADYAFTISAITAASAITIATPTGDAYADATDMFFGKTGSGTLTFVGIFPQRCTWNITLPTGIQTLERVYWNDVELGMASRDYMVKQDGSGAPTHYNVRDDKLYLYPSPESQGECYIEYKGVPTDMTTFTAEISSLPEPTHEAVTNWVASQLLKEQYDEQLAARRYTDFLMGKAQYTNSIHNRDTLPRGPAPRSPVYIPKVIV